MEKMDEVFQRKLKETNNNTTCPCLLIWSDGYEIGVDKYESKAAAYRKMSDSYQEGFDELWEEFKELSYISDDKAVFYDNGNGTYCWQLYELKEDGTKFPDFESKK